MLELKDKKILYVVPKENFSDSELNESMRFLENEGADMSIASSDNEPVESNKGILILTDLSLGEVEHKNFDGVVFIGGKGAESLFYNKEAQRVAKEFSEQNKIVGAISTAVAILANSGILEGKKVTGHPSIAKKVNESGEFVEKEILRDGNLITVSKKDHAELMGEYIAENLKEGI